MGKHVSVCLVCFFSFILFGCTSLPLKAYKGDVKPAGSTALFSHDDAWGNNVLYKVDGETAGPELLRENLYFGTYNNKNGGFILSLLPGRHNLEIVLLNSKRVVNIEFSINAGDHYVLNRKSEKLWITRNVEKDAPEIEAVIKDIPFYKEPSESEPHARLVQESGTKSSISIFRIDGMPGKNRITYNFGITDPVNPRVVFGSFDVRLSPGKHVIDYVTVTGRSGSPVINTMPIVVEAGKKYKFETGPEVKLVQF